MDIRKVGAAAGFAAGAAFALAPLASADVGIGSTVDSEIASMNKLFDLEATLAGKAGDIIPATDSNPFDTIPSADAPQSGVGLLDHLLYGVNPAEAQPASDPGSYNVFNGALGKFDDAYNVLLYAAHNGGAMDLNDADFIGSQSSIDHAQGLATPLAAAEYFLKFGEGDLQGYFGIFPQAADSAAATPAAGGGLFDSLLAGEVQGMNHIFDMDVHLAGLPATDIIPGSGVLPFDTIDPANTNDMLNTLLFGFNPDNITGDPGAYDVLNGALGEFANAVNVESFSLLNGGDMLPAVDLIGTHSDLLTGSVAEAFSGFLHLGLADLAGFFDIGALGGGI